MRASLLPSSERDGRIAITSLYRKGPGTILLPSNPLPEMACFEQAGDKYQEFSVDIEVFRLVRHRDFQSFYSVICEFNGI